jgi:hypothetical protein
MVTILLVLFDPRDTNAMHKIFPSILTRIYALLLDRCLMFNFVIKNVICEISSKHKRKDLDINNLLIGLVGYKPTDDFRIKESGKRLIRKKLATSQIFKNSMK